MNPHRTHRPDNNRDEIREAFERLGLVYESVNDGSYDALVHAKIGNTWYTWPVEIKNGPAGYTPKEQAFMDKHPGLVTTVRSVEDVERMFG